MSGRYWLRHSRHGDAYPADKWYSGQYAEADARKDARALVEAARLVYLRQWDGNQWVQVKL